MMERRRNLKQLGPPEQYHQLNQEIQRECRRAKEQYYEEKCTEIERLDQIHSNKLHRKVRELKPKPPRVQLGIKDKHGKILHEEEDILKRWEEYIGEDLYKDNREGIPTINCDYDTAPNISQYEVEKAIQKLSRNKSPGEDGVPAELLQLLGRKKKEQSF